MKALTENLKMWQSHLDAAETSGMALTEYAAEHDLSVTAMYTAKQRLRERSVSRSTFVRVSEARIERSSMLQVRLPNGVTVAVPTDTETVNTVLKSLAAL